MGPIGWSFAYDAIFQVLFALITLGIGFFALRIYFFSKQRPLKTFGLSFLCIAASFFALSFLNFGLTSLFPFLDQEGLSRLIIASYMGLYILGVITLAYNTLKVKNDQTYIMLLLVTFIAIVVATHKLYLFYAIAAVFLGYVCVHYLFYFIKKKRFKNFLVMLAFAFLCVANIALMFSVQNAYYYSLGHYLELVGYLALLINFGMVIFK